MANKIVAYIGYDSFDIIFYLSKILKKLGQRVLIVDYSETAALSYSIPSVEGIDTLNSIMTYRQIDFTRMVINEEIVNEYDDVFIACGFNEPEFIIKLVTNVIYVTNMFKFNLNRLYHIKSFDEIHVKKELLVREAVDLKMPIEYMAEITGKKFAANDISFLYWDDKDYENCLIGHYNQTFRFTKISGMLRGYLLKVISELCSFATDKQILTAYSKARKGE